MKKLPRVSVTTKIYVMLAYSVLAGVWYVLDPESSSLSLPYGLLIVRLLAPFIPVIYVGNILLVPAGDRFTAPYVVRMLDVCVGFFLLASSGLFLWLRGATGRVILGTVLGLFILNTIRVVSVIIALRTYGYTVAAGVHDIFYAGFTTLAIAIMAYGALGAYRQITGSQSAMPLLRRKPCP